MLQNLLDTELSSTLILVRQYLFNFLSEEWICWMESKVDVNEIQRILECKVPLGSPCISINVSKGSRGMPEEARTSVPRYILPRPLMPLKIKWSS